MNDDNSIELDDDVYEKLIECAAKQYVSEDAAVAMRKIQETKGKTIEEAFVEIMIVPIIEKALQEEINLLENQHQNSEPGSQ